jgi:hypothetical protein
MAWKVRIEWLINEADGAGAIRGSQTLSGSGATAVQSEPVPQFKNRQRGAARITVITGAVLVAIDDSTPTETDSVRIASSDDPYQFSPTPGQVLWFAEAADGPAAGGGGGGGTSDATQANQVLANSKLDLANAALGAPNDAEALTGNGSFIAISRAIRTLLTQIKALFPTALGPQAVAASLSIVPATAAIFPVGGGSVSVSVTPTVTAVAYDPNDVVGGELAFAGAVRVVAGSALLQSLLIQSRADLAATGVSLEVYFFGANPATNPTDNNVISLAEADFDKYMGHVEISDWKKVGTTFCVGQAQNLAIPVRAAAGETIVYAIIVTRSAVTMAVGDLKVTARFLQD